MPAAHSRYRNLSLSVDATDALTRLSASMTGAVGRRVTLSETIIIAIRLVHVKFPGAELAVAVQALTDADDALAAADSPAEGL